MKTLFSPVFTRVCCVFPKLEKIRSVDSIPVRATNLRLLGSLGLVLPYPSRSHRHRVVRVATDRDVSSRRSRVDWNQAKVLRVRTARGPMTGYAVPWHIFPYRVRWTPTSAQVRAGSSKSSRRDESEIGRLDGGDQSAPPLEINAPQFL